MKKTSLACKTGKIFKEIYVLETELTSFLKTALRKGKSEPIVKKKLI